MSLDGEIQLRVERFNQYLQEYFTVSNSMNVGNVRHQVIQSMEYSLFGNGKRFRPLLSIVISELFGLAPDRIYPWATAIEMVHTYSLIHDDLPCMDDDDERRGAPTNHKKFDEATALLAGDALIPEAFVAITNGYSDQPFLIAQLTKVLAEAISVRGMVGGQAADLVWQKASDSENIQITLKDLDWIHQRKTAALIAATCHGAGLVLGLPNTKVESLKEFGELLGLAFQIKDDLLDADHSDQEIVSYVSALGRSNTESKLSIVTKMCYQILADLKIPQTSLLNALVQFNEKRDK